MARISIAMATYNGADYLKQQLESLSNQTLLPDELVVLDDGSSDDSIAIVELFARSCPFDVQVRKNSKNLGYAKNFEQAMKLCSGDIIFLCDQDDVWFRTKIEAVVGTLDREPYTWVLVNDAEVTDEYLESTGRAYSEQLKALGFGDDEHLIGCCVAVRRRFIDLVCPVPVPDFVHDTWISALSGILGLKKTDRRILQYWRRHGGSNSRSLVGKGRPTRIFDKIAEYAFEDVRGACARRIHRLRHLDERIRASGGALEALPDSDRRITSAIEEVRETKAAVLKRLELLSHGRWSRLGPAVQMYRLGCYDHFSGFASLVKDLFLVR